MEELNGVIVVIVAVLLLSFIVNGAFIALLIKVRSRLLRFFDGRNKKAEKEFILRISFALWLSILQISVFGLVGGFEHYRSMHEIKADPKWESFGCVQLQRTEMSEEEVSSRKGFYYECHQPARIGWVSVMNLPAFLLGSYAATHSSSIGIYDQVAVFYSITAIATIVFWYVVGAWIDLRIRKKDLAAAPA